MFQHLIAATLIVSSTIPELEPVQKLVINPEVSRDVFCSEVKFLLEEFDLGQYHLQVDNLYWEECGI